MKKGEIEIILVGDELLKGERRDAHLAFIGNLLATIGVRVTAAHAIGDDRHAIAALLRDRVDDARAIIVSGGLGPTHDDITREGVADGLGLELQYREEEWQTIVKIFEQFGVDADESNSRQAYFPEGAVVIANPKGTAAGFMVEREDLLVAVLPGPPRELNAMMRGPVIDRLNVIFQREPIFKETFRTCGIGESTMTPLVKPIFDEFAGDFVVSSLPHLGGVDIVLTQKSGVAGIDRVRTRAGAFEKRLREALGTKLYATGDDTLEAVIGGVLAERGETLAVAESLTGGLLGKRFTDVPGSSRYLLADVVAYSDESKVTFLGVGEGTLRRQGAVSETVCRQMAEGARQRCNATYGLATTGIAGPDGGSDEKPVGLTYYGLVWDGGAVIKHRVFPGGREDVRERVAFATFFLLHERLQSA